MKLPCAPLYQWLFITVVDSRTAYTELLPKSNTIFKGNPLPFIYSYWSRNSSAAVFINNPLLSLYECHNHSFGKFPLQYEYTTLEYIISVFLKQINGLPLHIINAKHCISSTLRCCISSSRSIMHAGAWWYTAPKGLMICTALCAVMIYQACGLDKKRNNFWKTKVVSFLVRGKGLEPSRQYWHKHLKLACLPIPASPRISIIYYSRTNTVCQAFFIIFLELFLKRRKTA